MHQKRVEPRDLSLPPPLHTLGRHSVSFPADIFFFFSHSKPVTLLNCLQNTNYTLFPAGETFENFPLEFTTDS